MTMTVNLFLIYFMHLCIMLIKIFTMVINDLVESVVILIFEYISTASRPILFIIANVGGIVNHYYFLFILSSLFLLLLCNMYCILFILFVSNK